MVIGGSGSGKSEYAESRCVQFGSEKKLYIATMEPFGAEGAARIERHRKLRQGKGFETLECYTHLEESEIPQAGTILLECMSNLAANEMFSPQGRPEQMESLILQGVSRLRERAEHVVIVTNEVFSDGIVYDPMTMEYIRHLGVINQRIAQMADEVYEVVHGIPICIKE